MFEIEAFIPGLATERAPLICADAASYDRSLGVFGVWLAHEDGLKMNRYRLAHKKELPHVKSIPHLYMGGIDPICTGADPEFCGMNAVAVSEVTNGY